MLNFKMIVDIFKMINCKGFLLVFEVCGEVYMSYEDFVVFNLCYEKEGK